MTIIVTLNVVKLRKVIVGFKERVIMLENEILKIIRKKAETDRAYANFERSLRIAKKYKHSSYYRLIAEMARCKTEKELVEKLETVDIGPPEIEM